MVVLIGLEIACIHTIIYKCSCVKGDQFVYFWVLCSTELLEATSRVFGVTLLPQEKKLFNLPQVPVSVLTCSEPYFSHL